ncbi:MFS transporter [Arthrobacter roseus]|uniref:MFS transporter n=1 Tax=Arthrobacter roseus TaxID=136274 RepID=UPI0019662584|nr:MFS family permease [Arthrobacter roseus]
MTVISELRMRPVIANRWGWDASVTVRLVLAGLVFSVLLIGANLATPIYPLLQAKLGLSAFDVTVAFSTYVLALIAGLLLMGHWSDHMGRRAALVVAVFVGIIGGLVFSMADGLLTLSLGRALQGASVALATGASSAALREMLPHRPEWASRFTLLASAGGVAAGPVIGGLLSILPDPTRVPFQLHVAVLVLMLIPLLALKARPAISPAMDGPMKALKPRVPTVSKEAGSTFWMASIIGFLSFSVFGFTLSLAPTYFAEIAHASSPASVGILAAIVLMASAVSQLIAMRGRFVVPVGLCFMAAGVALIPVAGMLGSLPLLIGACIAAGSGQGFAFRVAFNDVALKVESSRHAQIISMLYVITYLGSALPVLGLGMAAGIWGLPASVAFFSGAIALACLLLAGVALRRVP